MFVVKWIRLYLLERDRVWMATITVLLGDVEGFLFSLCLNARQPVLNRLNARQSEIFTEFPLKDSFKRLDGIWRVSMG